MFTGCCRSPNFGVPLQAVRRGGLRGATRKAARRARQLAETHGGGQWADSKSVSLSAFLFPKVSDRLIVMLLGVHPWNQGVTWSFNFSIGVWTAGTELWNHPARYWGGVGQCEVVLTGPASRNHEGDASRNHEIEGESISLPVDHLRFTCFFLKSGRTYYMLMIRVSLKSTTI